MLLYESSVSSACVSQVKYWRMGEDNEQATKAVSSWENQTKLENMKPDSQYLIEVRAYNAAGYGPPSHQLKIHTEKARRFPCCVTFSYHRVCVCVLCCILPVILC